MAKSLMVMPSCDAWTDSHPVEDSYLIHPRFDPKGRLPFHFATIHECQAKDQKVLTLPQKDPRRYFIQKLDNVCIICCIHELTHNSPSKIVIPNNMLVPLVKWYHKVTVHSTGMDRLGAALVLKDLLIRRLANKLQNKTTTQKSKKHHTNNTVFKIASSRLPYLKPHDKDKDNYNNDDDVK
eukprot:jgi/Psemu1/60256/gm1.60256_g